MTVSRRLTTAPPKTLTHPQGRRALAVFAFAVALASGCDTPPACTGCPDLVAAACACFGEGSNQCFETKAGAEKLCTDNPAGEANACAGALAAFDCARDQAEGTPVSGGVL